MKSNTPTLPTDQENKALLIQGLAAFIKSLIANRMDALQFKPLTYSNETMTVRTLKKLDIPLTINNKKISVVKLRLFTNIDESSTSREKGYLALSFSDKSKLAFPIFEPEKKAMIDLCYLLDCTVDHLLERVHKVAIDWINKSMNSIYSVNYQDGMETAEHYDKIHSILCGIINDTTKRDRIQGEINIIDAGCGTGRFINIAARNIHADKNLVGFDINQTNIEEAKATPGANFFMGDIYKINEAIETSNQFISKDAKTFIILSGSLTRLVISDSFSALNTLQMLARSEHADYLVGCGVGEPLLNKHIAKQVGFEMSTPKEGADGNVFFCKKMSIDQIISQKIAKYAQGKVLDLSLSPFPATIINHPDIQKILDNDSTIDLSFSALTPEAIDSINKMIGLHPQIKLIYWSNKAENIRTFYNSFPESNIQSLLLMTSELALTTSKSLTLSLNLGQAPISTLLGPKNSITPENYNFICFYVKNALKNQTSITASSFLAWIPFYTR